MDYDIKQDQKGDLEHQENNVLNSYMSIIVLLSFIIKEIVCKKKSTVLKRKKNTLLTNPIIDTK